MFKKREIQKREEKKQIEEADTRTEVKTKLYMVRVIKGGSSLRDLVIVNSSIILIAT